MSTLAETAVANRFGFSPFEEGQNESAERNIPPESPYLSRATVWNFFQYLDSIECL